MHVHGTLRLESWRFFDKFRDSAGNGEADERDSSDDGGRVVGCRSLATSSMRTHLLSVDLEASIMALVAP
ncbi:hypothetical protein M0804_007512 [Polistes exclamans]|nr:hypothetical protein M0804_007512 [Polistes exclamans]